MTRALLLVALLSCSVTRAGELVGPVSDETVEPLVRELGAAHENDRVNILIDSPGGNVGSGMVLVDAIRAAKRRGAAIVCIVDGQASSMAAYVLQVCTLRVMLPGSFLLFHAPKTEVRGTAWDLERTAVEMRGIERIFAVLTTGRMHLTVAEFEARISDRDWILSPAEALALGAADVCPTL